MLKIELVSLRSSLKWQKRHSIFVDIINHSSSDIILFCGHSLIKEDEVFSLEQEIANKDVTVLFEVREIEESDFVKFKHGLFMVEQGKPRNLFTNQLFSTHGELDNNEMLCERFIQELENKRHFVIKEKRILILQCGELNIIKNLQGKDNQPIFRIPQREDLQVRFEKLLEKTDIVLNPIHTPMGNQGKMHKRRELLSSNNRFYFSTSQNGEKKMEANSLQYAYYNGKELYENNIEVTDDYQIRCYVIE